MHHLFDDHAHDFGSADHHHHADPFGHHHLHAGDSHHSGIDDPWHHLADPLHSDPIHGDGTHSHQLLDHSSITGDQTLGSVVETHYPHFNPSYIGPGIIGDPAHDMTEWHYQLHSNTCAIAAQEFLLDHFGLHFSENELQHEALVHGWYTQHGGTPMARVGDLLAYHGIPVESHEGATINELTTTLSQGHPAIVTLNAEDIWYHGTPNDPLTGYPGIPGQHANHAVEVIGLDQHDPLHPAVILNDPGSPDGRGIEVPLTVFEHAWAASDHFMMTVSEKGTHLGGTAEHVASSGPLLGDAQSDADWAAWDAKRAADKADWANWDAKRAADKADWAVWEAKRELDSGS